MRPILLQSNDALLGYIQILGSGGPADLTENPLSASPFKLVHDSDNLYRLAFFNATLGNEEYYVTFNDTGATPDGLVLKPWESQDSLMQSKESQLFL